MTAGRRTTEDSRSMDGMHEAEPDAVFDAGKQDMAVQSATVSESSKMPSPAAVSMPEDFASRWAACAWQFIHTPPASATANLALDEALLDAVATGRLGPTIRIWEWTGRCAILGRFQSVSNEIDVEAAKREGVGLHRRISGGGTMFIEPAGAITWSVYVPDSFIAGLDIRQSYALFDSWVVEALRSLGVDAFYRPINDIACPAGKISGAAQARRAQAVLHHATMAYSMSQGTLAAVLRTGKAALSGRGLRSAVKVVAPVDRQIGVSRAGVLEAMKGRLAVRCSIREGSIDTQTREASRRLEEERYATEAWTFLLP